MRTLIFASVVAAIFFGGCKYSEPISQPQGLNIDKSILGTWKFIPEKEGKEDKKDIYLYILEFSSQEYLAIYLDQTKDRQSRVYLRGYPIKFADRCVQLECKAGGKLDSEEAPELVTAGKGDKVYDVIRYKLEGKKLQIEESNKDVVAEYREEGDSLADAFNKAKDDKRLFKISGSFKRVK